MPDKCRAVKGLDMCSVQCNGARAGAADANADAITPHSSNVHFRPCHVTPYIYRGRGKGLDANPGKIKLRTRNHGRDFC